VKRIFPFFLIFLVFCGRKEPPPGKPELIGPEIRILSPEEGDTVKGKLKVIADVKDSSGVKLVRVLIDQTEAGVDSEPPYEFEIPIRNLKDTLHTVQILAEDKWDNTSSKEIRIFIESER